MATADCPILISSEQESGLKANAFRIMHDSESEFFLDFLSYSEKTNQATVIARIRVSTAFLDLVRDRLDKYLEPTATSWN